MNRPASRYVSYHHAGRATTTLPPSGIRKGFVFAPLYRSADKPADAVTFQGRAGHFASRYGLPAPMLFDNDGDNDALHIADNSGLRARRTAIVAAMDAAAKPFDVVAYFGHGVRRGLSSAGFTGREGLRVFAEAVARNASRRIVIVLNACSCGYPGGFAEQLWGELARRGVVATIFAHNDSGHTTNNPTKRRYPGGDYLVEPRGPRYGAWRNALWHSDLWARYAVLEPDELARAF